MSEGELEVLLKATPQLVRSLRSTLEPETLVKLLEQQESSLSLRGYVGLLGGYRRGGGETD